jgi:hypothetical protein
MRHAFVRVVYALALVGSGAAVAACGGNTDVSTGPPVAGRVYVLQSVNGQPLPYDVFASGGDTTAVLNETITLRDDGTATRAQTIRTVSNGGPGTLSTSVGHYTYTVSGTEIVLQYSCPGGAMCIAAPRGTITDVELALLVGGTTESPTWRYTRLFPPD